MFVKHYNYAKEKRCVVRCPFYHDCFQKTFHLSTVIHKAVDVEVTENAEICFASVDFLHAGRIS